MTSDFLDRLEDELVAGMKRHQTHPLRHWGRRLLRTSWPAAAIAALALAAIVALLLPPAEKETDLNSVHRNPAAPAPPATAHVWRPVERTTDIFNLRLTATTWHVAYDTRLALTGGHLRWSGDTFTVSADVPCTTAGVYRVALEGGRLRITVTRDPCAQRRTVLDREWLPTQ